MPIEELMSLSEFINAGGHSLTVLVAYFIFRLDRRLIALETNQRVMMSKLGQDFDNNPK